MKKILITIRENGDNGGPNNSHLRILCFNWEEHGFIVNKLLIPPANELKKKKIKKYIVNKIKKENPDLVQFAGLQLEGFLMCKICKKAKVKSLVAVHGSSLEAMFLSKWKKKILYYLEKYTLRKTNYNYVVSEYVYNWKLIKESNKCLGIVYNLPFLDFNNSLKNDIRKEFGFSENDFLITTTGRITIDKGYDCLCKIIINHLWEKNVKFLIVGDGNYITNFKKEIKNHKLENQVFFLGYRKDVNEILNQSNLFIICSHHETFCMSILEACFKKIPIVASNVGGIKEIIINNKTGLLFEDNDINKAYENIIKMFKNNDFSKKIAENAFNYVNDKFNPDKTFKKLKDIYLFITKENE